MSASCVAPGIMASVVTMSMSGTGSPRRSRQGMSPTMAGEGKTALWSNATRRVTARGRVNDTEAPSASVSPLSSTH